jgi:hypothetical protein
MRSEEKRRAALCARGGVMLVSVAALNAMAGAGSVDRHAAYL